MKNNFRCYACVYCLTCDKENEEKCANMHYALFTTKEDVELCNLMCGEPQEENED